MRDAGSAVRVMVTNEFSTTASRHPASRIPHPAIPPSRLIPYGVPRNPQKHILQIRQFSAEIRDGDVVVRDVADDVGHQTVAHSANRVARIFFCDRGDPEYSLETFSCIRIACRKNHASFWTVFVDELLWLIDVDDAAVIHDRDAIAQTLGFLH